MQIRPDIINREKSSSHKLAPGRMYNGQVRSISSNGKIVVYVPELATSYGDLIPLNTTPNNQYSVGDTVKCMFTDEFFKELVVIGAARIGSNKHPSLSEFNNLLSSVNVLSSDIAQNISDISSLQLSVSAAQASITSLQTLGTPVSSTSTNRNISSSDIGRLIYTNVTSTANTITIPAGITSTLGHSFHVLQYGTGRTQIVSASGTPTVTVRATTGISSGGGSGVIYLRTQYSVATVIQITSNNWLVTGDISSS